MQWWMQHFTLEGTSTQLCCQSSEKLHGTSNNLGPSTPPGSITDMHKKNLVQPLFQMIKSLTWELSMIVWQSGPQWIGWHLCGAHVLVIIYSKHFWGTEAIPINVRVAWKWMQSLPKLYCATQFNKSRNKLK